MKDEFTVNGVKITDGMYVWDYDNDRVTVCFEHTSGIDERYSPFDGWFTVHPADAPHTRWGKLMNGERMVTVNPFTREPADNRDERVLAGKRVGPVSLMTEDAAMTAIVDAPTDYAARVVCASLPTGTLAALLDLLHIDTPPTARARQIDRIVKDAR